ncbi:hypothetical protein LDENG_00049100 [Lucifuga dentata]|nr:hypothetical protein LDENG_00049100 [Lucifuga dentata]
MHCHGYPVGAHCRPCWPETGWSIIQHHMPLYLLSSNMDQCLALTSAVTALPAVSVTTDDDGDGRSGLSMNPIRKGE